MVHRPRPRRSMRGAIGIVAGLVLVASVAALAVAGTSGRNITGTQTVNAGGSATFTVEYDSSGSHYYHVTATVTGSPAGVTVTPQTSTCVYYNGGNNHHVDLVVATTAGTTPVGSYTVSAVLSEYAWNDNDCNGANPDTHTLTSTLVVNKAVPTFSLSAITTKAFGDAPFNAVTSKPAGDTGAVTFATGAGSHGCTVNPSTGLVTITGTATGGQHCIISASLAADAYYLAAGPVTQQFHINAATPAFTFDLSGLPTKAYGDPAFSIAGYASKPSDDAGAITFDEGTGSHGCSVNATTGVVTITGTATGSHYCIITASLAANGNYAAAGPLTQQFHINLAIPAFTLSPIADKTLGAAPFNAVTSKPAADHGAVTFGLSAGSVGCTVNFWSGLVTITGAATGSDFCVIRASLAADGNYAAAGPVSQSFHINKPATTTGLTSSLNSSVYGQSVTFTATVSAGATGNVSFYDGATLLATVPLSGTQAALTRSALVAGSHGITATYNGDATHAASSSPLLTQVVDKAVLDVAPDAQAVVFGDPIPTYTFQITGWVLGDTQATAAGFIAPTCTSGYTPTSPTSSSPLTITCSGGDADDYTFNFATGSLSIGSAEASFDFSLGTLPAKQYGSGTFSVAGLATKPAGDNGAVTFALGEGSVGCTVTPAGLVTITSSATGDSFCIIEATLAADGSYLGAGPLSAKFNIARAAITVTPDAKSLVVGAPVPASSFYTFGMTGWVNGETAATAAAYVSPTCTSAYTAGTALADSPLAITCSGASAGDYDFAYSEGTLTVVSAAATATPTPVASATPTPTEQVGGVTAAPVAPTLPTTNTTPSQSDGGSTPLLALLLCLAFGGLGLLVVQAQRRSIRN